MERAFSGLIRRERAARRSRRKWPRGVILYEGPSELDGAPIVCIAAGVRFGSANTKCGPMIQTWILRSDLSPSEALKIDADRSVCGDCPLRGPACYVVLQHGPRSVFKAYQAGRYTHVDEIGLSWAEGRHIRFGAYGDPAAVPVRVWYQLAAHASAWTGYTHQAQDPRFQHLRFLLMASVDTPEQAWASRAAGWRTYRVRLDDETTLPFESICPASDEAGQKTTCFDCAQCDGTRAFDLRRSYVSIAHGAGAGAYRRLRLRIIE